MSFEREVLDGVYYVRGSLPSGADVGAAILASEGEALFFDSLYYPEETRRMIEIAETERFDPIGLVNTHWHVDHTAGNIHFNIQTMSHESCIGLMKTELPHQLENAKAKIGSVQAKYPSRTFGKTLKLTVGDRDLTLIHFPGHTPDSIVGVVERDRLLIAGDTVMDLPFVAYGNSQALLNSLRTIRSMDVSLIIQGHGAPCGREKLDGDIHYLEELRRIVGEESASGRSLDEVENVPVEQFIAADRLESLPALYKERIHKSNVERVFHEFAGAE